MGSFFSLLVRGISQTVSGAGKDAIRKTYPPGKQYSAFRATKEGRKYLDAFARRISGANRRKMIEMFAISIIKIRIMEDRKRKQKGFWIFDNKSSNLRDSQYFGKVGNSH